jgi:CBS domain-containing protein
MHAGPTIDLAAAVRPSFRRTTMKIQDVMTIDVVTCKPTDSASHAARMMWEHDCGVIPVVDDEYRPLGMLTDRDVCMAAYTTGRSLADIRVEEVMSGNVQTCCPEDSIGKAELSMQDRRVRRLPVVDGDKRLVGILSLNDIARRAAQDQGRKHESIAMEHVAETLASVCEPWCSILSRNEHPLEQAFGRERARASASHG